MVSVDDGRVLALAGRHRAAPATNDVRLATSAWAPAASVFKLVTSAALLGEGVTPATRVCYHGGVHSVEADNLEDHPELDGRCKSLGYGLAKSQNAILARLAHDHLDPVKLERGARARLRRAARVRAADDGVDAGAAVGSAGVRARRRRLLELEPVGAARRAARRDDRARRRDAVVAHRRSRRRR